MPTAITQATLDAGQPYNDIWRRPGETEREKYATIEHDYNQHRAWLLQVARVIVEEGSLIKELGPWEETDPRNIFMSSLGIVLNVLENEAKADQLFADYRAWRQSDALYRRKGIKLHQEGAIIVVRESLIDSRYYCEHKKGTHIFYYAPPKSYITGQTYAKFILTDSGIVEFHKPPPRMNPNAPAERSFFTYCGQVPRPTTEYAMRLDILLPRIVEVILCVIVWEGRNRKFPENGISILSSWGKCPMRALLQAVDFWDIVFGKDKYAPKRVCEHLKKNRVLTEAAYLIVQLETRSLSTTLEANLRMVADMISRIMAMPFEAAAELEHQFVKSEAFQELFDRETTQDWFIWGNQNSTLIVNNIHEHYCQDEFNTDPLSVARSDSVDSLWAAVRDIVQTVPSLSPEFLHPRSSLRRLRLEPVFPLELTSPHIPSTKRQVPAQSPTNSAAQRTPITCALAISSLPSPSITEEDYASSADTNTEPTAAETDQQSRAAGQTSGTTGQLSYPEANPSSAVRQER